MPYSVMQWSWLMTLRWLRILVSNQCVSYIVV
jgi:hypothetical protein